MLTNFRFFLGAGFVLISLLSQSALALRPSEGCFHPQPFNPIDGTQTQTLQVLGQTRTFLLNESGPDGLSPRPVVFVFHGRDAKSQDAENFGFQPTATALHWNALFVYPQGLPMPDAVSGWNETCGGNDQLFFKALVESVGQRECIDLDKVFASGFSWGADFSHSLACCQGDVLRAIAPLSGADVLANPLNTCTARIPPVLLQYGLADEAYSQSEYQQATDFYLQRNSCGPYVPLPGDADCYSGQDCRSPLFVCKIPGQGHEVKEPEIVRAITFLQAF